MSQSQGYRKGRGATDNVTGRFEQQTAHRTDDGWDSLATEFELQAESTLPTRISDEQARSIISRNQSPDVPFSQSVNPYRGCEHGCVYCFARPSHSYLGLSPGLDFETQIFAKRNAPELLAREIAKPSYRPLPIALGINTDGYQPTERKLQITRECLQVLADANHPLSIVTKSALVTRDLDLLAPMAAKGLAHVFISVTTLDNRLSAKLEPRAAAPHTRLKTIRTLSEAGIPTGVLIAPVIPMLTDMELERMMQACAEHGAHAAGYVLLRLPHELKDLWHGWLQTHYPERADHIISLLKQMHGGKEYDSAHHTRMKGQGPFADLIRLRFAKAKQRFGLASNLPALDTTQFRTPATQSPQPDLFG